MKKLPAWERVLSAACRLQKILPEAVLTGGSAASVYAEHRLSEDADHVLPDLRERFDGILSQLESVAGWKTARVNRPVLILGRLDGIDTGIRQLRRVKPLETRRLKTKFGALTLPTEAEMLRIKAWLVETRNATRDFVDVAAMSKHLGAKKSVAALRRLDELYPQKNGESPLQQLIKQLAAPRPYDLADSDLGEYRELKPIWRRWERVAEQCRQLSVGLMEDLAKG